MGKMSLEPRPQERRRKRRSLLTGAVFAALTAGPALAGQGALPILSPEAPPKFGEPGEASPLLAVFNAARVAQDPALEAGLSAEPELGLAPVAWAPAPQDNPTAGYDPTAGPSLTPMQSALQAALERLVARGERPNPLGGGDWRAARAAIAAFYAVRAYQPAWVDEDGLTEAGRAVLARLERAGDDGLDLSALALPRALKRGLAPDALAEAETAISAAVVVYAGQASGSRVPPSRVSPYIFLVPRVAEPGAALAETAAAPDPGRRLADFNPPQKGYRDLRDELKRLEAPESAEGVGRVLTADLDPDPLFDLQPGTARRRAKRGADARIHAASASAGAAFGASGRERAAILANMEMWRWEPRDMGEKRIEINVPDFSVTALDGDTVLFQARAIVGKPTTPTPVFSSLHALRAYQSVLAGSQFDHPEGDDVEAQFAQPARIRGEDRQGPPHGPPGARRRQCARADRVHVSERPCDLSARYAGARSVRRGDPRVQSWMHPRRGPGEAGGARAGGRIGRWTEERIEAAFGTRERAVFLPRPLPVHIEYFTEFVDESGELRERPDVYGWTRRVGRILARSSQD